MSRSDGDSPAARKPLDESGARSGWIVLEFLLHAARGVFSGRVLLLATLGLILAESGAQLMGEVSSDGGVGRADASFATLTEVTLLVRDAGEAHLAYWGDVVGPIGWQIADGSVDARTAIIAVWRLLVWSLFGVALARIAATHLTLRQRPTAASSLRRSWFGLPGQFFGPATLAFLAALCVGIVWLLGWIARLKVLGIVLGLIWPLVILLGIVAAVLAVAWAVGTPLMLASHAVERPDPFDAVSCGMAYVYQRPLRLIAYLAQSIGVAAVIGAILQAGVRLVGTVLQAWFEGHGYSSVGPPDRPPEIAMAYWWLALFNSIPAVFHAAYFWFAVTAIYLLLRRDIDEKQVDEIYEGEAPSPVSSSDLSATADSGAET